MHYRSSHMLSTHRVLIEKAYDELLSDAGLRKADFVEHKKRLESRPSYDDYIFPFKLTEAELKVRTDISRIVTSNVDIESSSDFTPIDLGYKVYLYKSYFAQ